jgi:hypothetical protein
MARPDTLTGKSCSKYDDGDVRFGELEPHVPGGLQLHQKQQEDLEKRWMHQQGMD